MDTPLAQGGKPENDHTLRNVAMATAAGVPMSSSLWTRNDKSMPSPQSLSFDELKANLRPRDIVMSGETNNAMNKFMVGLGTSEPTRVHGEVILDAKHPKGPQALSAIYPGGVIHGTSPTIKEHKNLRILRRKADPSRSRAGEAADLREYVREYKKKPVDYSFPRAARAGLGETFLPERFHSMLPNGLNKRWIDPELGGAARARKVICNGAICTNVTANAFPEIGRSGRDLNNVTNSQLNSMSDLFDVVGDYKPSNEFRANRLAEGYRKAGIPMADMAGKGMVGIENALQGTLRHGKGITRGVVGLGGAGAVYGASRAMGDEHDLSKGELAAGAGMMAAGAAPVVPMLPGMPRPSEKMIRLLQKSKIPAAALAASGLGLIGYNLAKDRE